VVVSGSLSQSDTEVVATAAAVVVASGSSAQSSTEVEAGAGVEALVELTGFAMDVTTVVGAADEAVDLTDVINVVGTADEAEAADEAGAEPDPLMVKSMQLSYV